MKRYLSWIVDLTVIGLLLCVGCPKPKKSDALVNAEKSIDELSESSKQLGESIKELSVIALQVKAERDKCWDVAHVAAKGIKAREYRKLNQISAPTCYDAKDKQILCLDRNEELIVNTLGPAMSGGTCGGIFHEWVEGPLLWDRHEDPEGLIIHADLKTEYCKVCGVLRIKP